MSPDYSNIADWEETFSGLVAMLCDRLQSHEHLTIALSGECSQFSRFNQGKVRQTGIVTDASVSLTLLNDRREAFAALPFAGDSTIDRQQALEALNYLRVEVEQLPENPYTVVPQGSESSRAIHAGDLLPWDAAIAHLLGPVADLDFVGFYAAGTIVRASATSAGQRHWFATDSFCVDYSIFAGDRAVKGSYAGRHWQPQVYAAQIARSRQQLPLLQLPTRAIPRGQYRTYLAPAAASELIDMLRGAFSEASLQQGSSALLPLYRRQKSLASQFSLSENFANGSTPRFNERGELAPTSLALVTAGQLEQTLVNAATAKEYGKAANGADRSESLRSPVVAGGDLPEEKILMTLDRGLYLSNLHYLNWSDRPNGRVTGMTRYACFWVEGGEIVAPIENLRFDESIYECLGENLLALTDFQEFIPATDTYGRRALGGITVPGLLTENFTFTL